MHKIFIVNKTNQTILNVQDSFCLRILLNSSTISLQTWYVDGTSNVGPHVWAIGLLATLSIAMKATDIQSVIRESLPVTNFRKIFKDGLSKDRTNFLRKSKLCFSESLVGVAFRALITFLALGFMSEYSSLIFVTL